MALINPTLPTIGQPNSTEDQDVLNALTTIVAAINGGLDAANITDGSLTTAELATAAGIVGGQIADGTLSASKLATAVQAAAGLNGASTRRGKCNVPGAEARASATYGTLTTPDQVASITLPTDGLIAVMYQAQMQESVAGAGRAAIFVGSNQLKVAHADLAAVTQAAASGSGSTGVYMPVSSGAIGLFATTPGSTPSYVTTGQVVGQAWATSASKVSTELGSSVYHLTNGADAAGMSFVGGPCYIWAAAGTYTISVQYKATSGTVTAKERQLWVWSQAFD